MLGPTLGGWITDNYSWHWIFLINVPIGALSLFLVSNFVAEPKVITDERKRRWRKDLAVDYIGFLLAAARLGKVNLTVEPRCLGHPSRSTVPRSRVGTAVQQSLIFRRYFAKHAISHPDRRRYSAPSKLDSARRIITQLAAIWLVAILVIAGLPICQANPTAISNIAPTTSS